MTAPLNPSVPDSPPETLVVLFRIISRHSWDRLQDWHQTFPGSTIEHVMEGTGLFVLIIPPDGAKDIAA